MGITVTVGIYDETGFIRPGSLSAGRTLGGRTTCEFAVRPNKDLWVPIVGEPVTIVRDGSTLFAGHVWSVRTRRVRAKEDGVPAWIEADVTCVDHVYIADRRVAGERKWANVTSGQIATDIANNDLNGEGIGTTFVTAGPTLETFEVGGYPSVTEALNSLADIVGMRWYIDESKELRWFNDSTLGYSAPFDVTTSNILSVEKYQSLEEYCNDVILKLPQSLREPATETFNASHPNYAPDGSRRQFAVPYPVAATPTVKVDGAEKTVGLGGVDTGKDWYWNQGSNWITQEDGPAALTPAQTLEVTYVGTDGLTVGLTNLVEMGNRAAIEGGTGKHTRSFDQGASLTQAQASDSAAALLDTLDELPAVIQYETDTYQEPSADLIRPGHRQAVTVAGVEDGAQYVVRSVRFQDRERWPQHIGVVVELVRGPLLQDFVGLLKSLTSGPSIPAGANPASVGTPPTPSLPDPIASITASVIEYTNGADGQNYAHIGGAFPIPATGDIVGIWIAEGAAPAPEDFKGLLTVDAAKGSYDFWYLRPRAGVRLWVMACNADAAGGAWRKPTPAEPTASVDIAAWGVPAQPTGCSVYLSNQQTIDGADYADLHVDFTPPASPDYQWTVVERYWADASWNPASGEGATQEEAWQKNGQIKEKKSFVIRQVKLPSALTRLVYRFRSADWSGQTNDTAPVTYNFTQTAATGLDLGQAKAASLDPSMAVIGSKLAVKDGGVTPAKFSSGTEPVAIVSGVPGAFTGQRVIYNSTDGRVYKWNGLAYVAIQTSAEIKAQLQASGLTAAEFASSIEPVSVVSSLPGSKTTNTVFNTSDGKLYRWNGLAYARVMNGADIKAELAVDKLTAGQISAGAISTDQLSTSEILIGGGGGKCPRFRVNDAFGNLIGFIGDDQAGFVGLWSSRGRFGGTFYSPIIDLSSSAATINGADFALNTASGNVTINRNSVTVAGRNTTVIQNALGSDRVAIGQREMSMSISGYENVVMRAGLSGQYWGSLYLYNMGSQAIALTANDGKVSATTLSGSSFVDAGTAFRLGGGVVVDSNRRIRWWEVYPETIALGSITINRWVPAYDSSGNYMGKIPIIP